MSDEKTYDTKNPEFIAKIHAEADAAIQAKFRRLRAEQEAQEVRIKEERAFTDSVIRAALGTEAPRTASPPLDVNEVLKTLKERSAKTEFIGSPTAKAFVLRPFSNVRDGVLDIDIQLIGATPDKKLQVLGPPYANQFVFTGKSGSGSAQASATRGDGEFDFIHGAGSGGGSAASSAGIWVQFVPDAPLPRFIQIRPYVEFLYQYHDSSNYGYTAHNRGSFGILVNSFNLQGNDRRTEQDYQYAVPVWSDSTGWWQEHSNPSWDGSDFDFAFIFGKEAPYFLASPGRIYMACIWCFGSLDAGAGFFGNASAVGDIRARVGFVVIGQQ